MSQALALLPEPPELPASPDDDALAAARAFAQAEKAEATRRAYRSDLRQFADWCTARALCPVPASAETVAAYLATLASAGLRASSIGRKAAAIGYTHRLAGEHQDLGGDRRWRLQPSFHPAKLPPPRLSVARHPQDPDALRLVRSGFRLGW